MTDDPKPETFFGELKRRKVVRVAIAYVAVAMWMLDSSERIFEIFALDDGVHRIMVIAAVAGLPLVLGLSWLFDLTSKGIVKTPAEGDSVASEADRDAGPPRFTRQLVATSVLVVIAMTGAGWYYMPNDRVDFQENRVAVASFTNNTGDPALDIQGIIVADEINRNLNRIEGLDVVPRGGASPSAANDGSAASPAQSLAERTRASLVVTGSYYPSGEDIVFQANVYDANEKTVIYSTKLVRADSADPTLAFTPLQEELLSFMTGLGGGIPLLETAAVRLTQAPKIDAYKQYALALQLIETRFLARDAQVAYLDSAVSLDSTFVGALTLSVMLRATYGDPDSARPHLDRLKSMLSL